MRKAQDSVNLSAHLRALAAAGSTADCSVARTLEENAEVDICLAGGAYDSMVFELPDRRVGYIMDLEITNQTSKTIYCSETQLRMSWDDGLFDWLPDPKETGRTFSYTRRRRDRFRERVAAAYESYCFPGGAQLEYPRDLVLNHILLKGCALQPGRPLTGLLLATGGPLPDGLRHGQWLNPTLALIASNHREHTAQLQLWTERLEVNKKRATRATDPYRAPLGFEVGSPVVCNQHGAAHTERSRSPYTDGNERI